MVFCSTFNYKVSDTRKIHILEEEGPTDSRHSPNRRFTEGAFPDTWNDEQVITAIENVVNAPKMTNKGTPVRFTVRGRNHGLNITVILGQNGEE